MIVKTVDGRMHIYLDNSDCAVAIMEPAPRTSDAVMNQLELAMTMAAAPDMARLLKKIQLAIENGTPIGYDIHIAITLLLCKAKPTIDDFVAFINAVHYGK